MNGVAMSTFTIDSDNNIQAHAEAPASSNPAEVFSTQKELAKLAADWPVTRLVEVWNSFAGAAPFDDLKPVKKFTSRKTAVARMWEAIQRLSPDVAQPAADVAPGKPRSRKGAAKPKPRARVRKVAKVDREDATEAREGSKKADVLDLMRRKQGVTLAEIMEQTGWQAHTVRGFVSGTISKKLGLNVESFRNAEKERAYRIKG
jgi:Protein of unknown function (DUF3489)